MDLSSLTADCSDDVADSQDATSSFLGAADSLAGSSAFVADGSASVMPVQAAGPSLLDRVKRAVGNAQSAIATPLQSAGQRAAAAVGATPQMSDSIGDATPFILLAILSLVLVVWYKHKGRKGSRISL